MPVVFTPTQAEYTMATQTDTKPDTRTREDTKQPHLWNVVLLDSPDHTFTYVIAMMMELFGHPLEKAKKIAKTVDSDGRAICLTTHKELAELKREQIIGYGSDPYADVVTGPMSSLIEPAVYSGDDDDDDEE